MAVPKYSFIVDDGRDAPETTVIDLRDLDHAKAEAIRTAGEMLADTGAGTVWVGTPWRLTVRDDHGRQALEVQFLIKDHSGH